MNKNEKQLVVSSLSESLKQFEYVYIADTSSLSAKDTNELRRVLHSHGVKMQVAKNTLIKRAMVDSGKDFGALTDVLKGTSAIMYSANLKAPAEAIKKFRGKNEKPALKGAYIDTAVFLGDNQLDALIQLKTKEEMVADIIAMLQSPAQNVISALQSAGGTLAGIVKTLSEKEN